MIDVKATPAQRTVLTCRTEILGGRLSDIRRILNFRMRHAYRDSTSGLHDARAKAMR
jgi:hypothetical protein